MSTVRIVTCFKQSDSAMRSLLRHGQTCRIGSSQYVLQSSDEKNESSGCRWISEEASDIGATSLGYLVTPRTNCS